MTSGASRLIKDHLAGGASLLHPNAAAALGAPGLAALLLPQILPVFSVVAPCHPGAPLRDLVLVQPRRATSKWIPAAITAILLACGSHIAAWPAQRQPPPPPPGSPLDVSGVTPVEIQRMFDAVALVKAQEQLQLSDDRYLPFLAKFKALQDVRRRHQQQRFRMLQELRRLANDGGSDEGALKDRMKALQDLDARSEAELHKAYEGVDSVLDVRQQARFRLFEEMMERQKIDLLTRARQANRPLKRNP